MPCESRHGTAAIGSLEWSRQVTEHRYRVQPHIPKFAQFERWKNKWVLEIGCGIGTDALRFAQAGAIVDGVDASERSIDLARQRVGLRGNPIFFFHDAEKYLPQGLTGYDLIYSFGALHHTPHPKKVLRLAFDRLKPNGELRVMLYAKWSIKFLLGQQPEAQAGCPLVRTYTAESARKLIEDAGFKVESIEKTHIFPWRIDDYVQHRFVKLWIYRIMPQSIFMWLERKLGHHLLLVARKT